MRETIIVAGSLAQRPCHGGHTWVFLQYLLGFRRLGWDVLFVDRLEPEMCVDADGAPAAFELSVNLRYLGRGDGALRARRALVAALRRRARGRRAAARRGGRASRGARPLLLNVMGFLDDEEILAAAPLRAFLDIDPGFGQIWQELGLAEPVRGPRPLRDGRRADRRARLRRSRPAGSTGSRPSRRSCSPSGRRQPRARRAPSPASRAGAGRSGRSSTRGGPTACGCTSSGASSSCPRAPAPTFEVALDIDEADAEDLRPRSKRTAGRWPTRARPRATRGATATTSSGSAAELMVAKNLYVDTRSGWFSDRSACYLASGRPVLAQDTGLRARCPPARGCSRSRRSTRRPRRSRRSSRDYERHSRAAREIAEEHFAAERVLPRLLERAGGRDEHASSSPGRSRTSPGSGGEAWVRLSWVRGLERLGFDVRFVEQLDRAAPAGLAARSPGSETVTERFGLADRATLLRGRTRRSSARPLDELLRVAPRGGAGQHQRPPRPPARCSTRSAAG